MVNILENKPAAATPGLTPAFVGPIPDDTRNLSGRKGREMPSA
jgi:hypothetical protein